MKKAAIVTLVLALGLTAKAEVPAFPGAEGAGMWAIGGRGGTVYEVTNLDDSGSGSFREAIEASGARIVVFRVAGTMELQSALEITNSYITIAGQTASGDGICLKNYPLVVDANDVIIRYMRFRPADNAEGQEGFSGDDIDSLSVLAGYDIIIDHCSASWSVDETLSVSPVKDEPPPYESPLGNVTIQWCIISESLYCSVHPKGCHGCGSLNKGSWGNEYSFHHNLFAHHDYRSPEVGNYNDDVNDPTGLFFDFRNNVVYNWDAARAGIQDKNGIVNMNFVANYYKQGLDSDGSYAFTAYYNVYSKGYFSGNYMNGILPADPWSLVQFYGFTTAQKDAFKQASPFTTAPVETDDALTAYERVLADAGATVPIRDAVDERIVNDVINGTGWIINDEDEVGGWPILASAAPPADTDHDGMPDGWELAKGLNPDDADDGPEDSDGDGYTNVEEYINSTDLMACDLHRDGVVDFLDMEVVASHWLESGGSPAGDLNGDDVVDFLDFAIIGSYWLQ